MISSDVITLHSENLLIVFLVDFLIVNAVSIPNVLICGPIFTSLLSLKKKKEPIGYTPADFLGSYWFKVAMAGVVYSWEWKKLFGLFFAILEVRRRKRRTRARKIGTRARTRRTTRRTRTRKQNGIPSAVGFLVCYRQWGV